MVDRQRSLFKKEKKNIDLFVLLHCNPSWGGVLLPHSLDTCLLTKDRDLLPPTPTPTSLHLDSPFPSVYPSAHYTVLQGSSFPLT